MVRTFAVQCTLFVLFIAVLSGENHAAEPPIREEITQSSIFLHHHPDLRYRRNGFMALERGSLEYALRHFRKAAWYSDKPSQAMIAEMYWTGSGLEQDRALAYVWMDLAAERGYPVFVAYREDYWKNLNPQERERALEVGVGIFSEFGDDVAKPRMVSQLRKGRTKFTGSRVGYVPFGLEVLVPSPSGGWMSIHEDQVYQKRFWHPDEYFAWQAEIFNAPPQGVVEVGPLQPDQK